MTEILFPETFGCPDRAKAEAGYSSHLLCAPLTGPCVNEVSLHLVYAFISASGEAELSGALFAHPCRQSRVMRPSSRDLPFSFCALLLSGMYRTYYYVRWLALLVASYACHRLRSLSIILVAELICRGMDVSLSWYPLVRLPGGPLPETKISAWLGVATVASAPPSQPG